MQMVSTCVTPRKGGGLSVVLRRHKTTLRGFEPNQLRRVINFRHRAGTGVFLEPGWSTTG
jgi:hypothetical protein